MDVPNDLPTHPPICNDVPSGSETIATSATSFSETWTQEEQEAGDALLSLDDSKLFCTPGGDGNGGGESDDAPKTEKTSRKLCEISPTSSCAAARSLSNSEACWTELGNIAT